MKKLLSIERGIMRKLATLTAIAALVTALGLLLNSLAWAGATQEALAYEWAYTDGMLTDPIGKAIYVQPGGRDKLNVTWIMQGAQPSKEYFVGFNLFMDDAPAFFGVAKSGQATGTVGGIYGTAGYYIVGRLTTDSDGDGSFHANLKNLPSNCYDIVFWIIPQPGSLYPEGATFYWGGHDLPEPQWEEVCIP